MKRTVFFLFIGIFGLIAGCSPSREKTVDRINSLEKRIKSDTVIFDKIKADSLLGLYENFIKENPTDSLTPGFLFKGANIANSLGDFVKSIGLLDQYILNHPQKPKAPMCLFLKGFIYENSLHDIDKARETYLLFGEKYPDNELAKDAKLAVVNLGKTPDMIYREIEVKRKADSTRMADSVSKATKKKRGH